ncbi:MAG: T9SS type A sorting domain-containing protein [bacterium]
MKQQKQMYRIIMAVILAAGICFATSVRIADPEPCIGLIGDEQMETRPGIPYLNGRGPGDQIGTTWYDYQANGGYGQRVLVDDNDQGHFDWMWRDAANVTRYCAWNFRYTDGSPYGETQAAPSWSGYVQLDITQDATPDSQKTVVTYHFDPGSALYSWVDIDGGQGWGTWPNTPRSPSVADVVWPYIAVTTNNDFVMACHGQPVPGTNMMYLYVSTDTGSSWTEVFRVDSCATISQFVRSSRNSGSGKVAFGFTKFITDSFASGQVDNNVWYLLSTDNGLTWGSPVNLTNYQPADTVRAYNNVNMIFDNNDNLHIAWTGRKVTDDYYEASNIFHWDEVSGNTTIVNSPSIFYTNDWWIAATGGGDYGNWRLPADQPQLIIDANGELYCLWHGNDDYNDFSAAGYINGEFYGAISYDNGATWTDYRNLTGTRSPGAGAGACDDEDYMTACPMIVNDSIFLTYVEDKDAGGWPQTEGVETENPVRSWVFDKSYVGIDEGQQNVPQYTGLNLYPNPSVRSSVLSYAVVRAGDVRVGLYDASGRLVSVLECGYRSAGFYAVDINTAEFANGTYFVVLATPFDKVTRSLVIMH